MLIRIVKALPAPLMDGHDVGRFREGRVYEVELPVGRYLVIAGYALAVEEQASDTPGKRRHTGGRRR